MHRRKQASGLPGCIRCSNSARHSPIFSGAIPHGLFAVAVAVSAGRIRHLRIAAGVLGHEPVDLIVLAVPVISADPITETALALVRRLLALTPEAA
jgi:hypothetical protein